MKSEEYHGKAAVPKYSMFCLRAGSMFCRYVFAGRIRLHTLGSLRNAMHDESGGTGAPRAHRFGCKAQGCKEN